MIDWCYPLLVWALIFGAATRGVQVLLRGFGPRWLPLLACTATVVPVQGLPLGRWLHGYNANFSIPLVAVLLGVILKPWLKRPLFNEQADRTSCWFGCVAGLLLYPFALGLSSFDPYSLGWQWPGVACVAAVLAVFLIWRENSFGLVLLAAGVAWQVGCLESDNAWDYPQLHRPHAFIEPSRTEAKTGSTEFFNQASRRQLEWKRYPARPKLTPRRLTA